MSDTKTIATEALRLDAEEYQGLERTGQKMVWLSSAAVPLARALLEAEEMVAKQREELDAAIAAGMEVAGHHMRACKTIERLEAHSATLSQRVAELEGVLRDIMCMRCHLTARTLAKHRCQCDVKPCPAKRILTVLSNTHNTGEKNGD